MTMTGKEKLYFLLERIQDAKAIAPSGRPLLLHPADDLNNKYSGIDLDQLFTKLEKDEKVLRVLQTPNRVRNAILEEHGRYRNMDDGRYHIKLLPAFDVYYLKIQNDPEYQEFTGKKPQPQKSIEVSSPKNQPTAHTLSANIVAYDLQAQYAETQNERRDSTFYLKVASYGKYVNEAETLQPILNQLYEESQYQINPLKTSWAKFYKTWKEYASDLISVADANGIKDEGPLQNEIEEIRNFINHPTPQFSGDDIPRYYQSYQEVVRRFDTLGKKNLIASKHLDQNGNIKLFSFYVQTETEWNKYKRVREISNWWAHYQVSRLAYGLLGNEKEKENYFSDDNEVDKLYKYEFEELSRDSSYSPVIIKRKKFEEWISRLHNYVIPRLQSVSQEKSPSTQGEDLKKRYSLLIEEIKSKGVSSSSNLEERYLQNLREIKFHKSAQTSNTKTTTVGLKDKKIKYDDKEARIFIGDTTCQLPPFKNEHYLCRVMFKKKIYQPTDWSVVYEKMSGDYEKYYGKPPKTREHWRTVYDTMVRVNNRIKTNVYTSDDLFSWQELTIKRNF